MSWMQTYTGKRFYPLNPQVEDIDPVDIAHSLSLLCRYGGHVRKFYSVAEHSIHLSNHVAPEFQLWALLHDATEAYVGDMVRPLKHQMPEYMEVEDKLMEVIATRFGLPELVIPAEVKLADAQILNDERAALMAPTEDEWVTSDLPALGVQIAAWNPPAAEQFFTERLNELWRG